MIKLHEELYSEGDEDREGYLNRIAHSRGCVVDIPGDDTLQIDLDTRDQESLFAERMAMLMGFMPVYKVERYRSKSGNTHVKITMLAELCVEHRIALQLFLGSDPMREMFSLIRLHRGIPIPVCLMRPVKALPLRSEPKLLTA